ncbi:N-acetylmuramidase family protein [Paramagnetospirillum marisnigri]|uniref:N-acetylmuramidase family protein n=1 Tax=Paramagnetospirillum marisnigri TaxID=1285242 RepID=UPI0009EF2101|nr:N-acetylmuramidase family protein [Paramagnetospirillum marisnigri]
MIDFHGPATRLGPSDILATASALGVSPAAVRAVCSVESSGGGFLPDGRPKILFEAHIFHRLTGGQFAALHPNISSAKWDRSLYGRSGAHQYDRLAEAMALDVDASIKSASWGMFQILGRYHEQCGFARAVDFALAMASGEPAQLKAFADFVTADPQMLAALRHLDWTGFARRYNGPGFAANNYHIKLADAYALAVMEA